MSIYQSNLILIKTYLRKYFIEKWYCVVENTLNKYYNNIDQLLPDINLLEKYFQNINLKISYTNEFINYDMQSSYNQFFIKKKEYD